MVVPFVIKFLYAFTKIKYLAPRCAGVPSCDTSGFFGPGTVTVSLRGFASGQAECRCFTLLYLRRLQVFMAAYSLGIMAIFPILSLFEGWEKVCF